MLRLFKAFSAQPRLAVVTRTLWLALPDMAHFFIVFFTIICTYAVMGVLLFGRDFEDFANFGRAVIACFRALMADFEWDALKQVGRPEAFVWFLTFMVLIVLVMLNMLLAIIMDTYAVVKSQLGEAN